VPAELTYPGVYVEELASGVRPIVGVSTSTTAFVGRALKGPVDKPVTIHSFADYERVFGGLWEDSRMSFAVRQYFQNEGREAVIVRVTRGVATLATPTTWALGGPAGDLHVEASSPGAWGANLTVLVNHDSADPANLFNLLVADTTTGDTETLRNLSVDPAAPTFVTKVLAQRSRLLIVTDGSVVPATIPAAAAAAAGVGGDDGGPIRDVDVMPASGRQGVRALDATDIFNLLCLPPLATDTDVATSTFVDAAAYLHEATRRALLIVDPPSASTDPAAIQTFQTTLNLADENAALFFPRLLAPNPLKDNLIEEFAPCGAIAGSFARTDATRGVWKAPAGTEARIAGISGLTYVLTDDENGDLNPLGINALRTFPLIGTVVWGSRTLRGADALTDQWKYIPVRRTALYIEETLYRGLKWVVFEPNDEPLWAQIRLNVGAFLNGLFRQGAFQGTTPAQAYFVKCDSETTTQGDIDRGVVNIVVGFAPLKPAEFVVLKIQQLAGQLAA
jgi:Bacteriophage tail sheath protein